MKDKVMKTKQPRDWEQLSRRERGQIIVILAFGMIGLLLAVGLAVDVGVLLMRQAQLDRAVDSAALAAIIPLAETDIDAAHVRGQQLLAANGIVTNAAVTGSKTVDNDPDCSAGMTSPSNPDWDYCGVQLTGFRQGAVRYHLKVRWASETYFMRLAGWNEISIGAEATAEYYSVVNLYVNDNPYGLLGSANPSLFGPQQSPTYGDPYSNPTSPDYDESQGVYTYVVAVPKDYLATYDKVRVELFDPGTENQAEATHTVFQVHDSDYGDNTDKTCTTARQDTCLLETGDTLDENYYWFVKIDENRGGGGYDTGTNTDTLFRLYYYDQDNRQVDLALYHGLPNDFTTDMTWVSPGAPPAERMPAFDPSIDAATECVFETLEGIFPALPDTSGGLCSDAEPATTVVDLPSQWSGYKSAGNTQAYKYQANSNGDFTVDFSNEVNEVPDIYDDEGSEVYQIFLEIHSLSGWSENGFGVWAGPPPDQADPNTYVPANINARQVYIQGWRLGLVVEGTTSPLTPHNSQGVAVYAQNFRTMNANYRGIVDVPLAYFGPDKSGSALSVKTYDLDAGDPRDPIFFYFDTSTNPGDWAACFDDIETSAFTESEYERFEDVNCGPADDECECADLHDGLLRLGAAGIPSGNGAWLAYNFDLPGDEVTFSGGTLYARYFPGRDDTFAWNISLRSRPYLVH